MTDRPGAASPQRDDDEFAAEFARILSDEGLALRPGEPPRELPALPPASARSADSPGTPSPEEREAGRARARAAHPSFRPSSRTTPADEDEDLPLPGDFVPPRPALQRPSRGALWSWGALAAGVAVLLVTATTSLLPSWCVLPGAGLAVGGIIALLLRAPRGREDPFDNGAQV